MRSAGPAAAHMSSRGSGRRIARVLASFAWITFTASSLAAEQPKPKLGPAAIPYWSSDEALLDAMLRAAPFERGRLAGETGGRVRVTRKVP